MTWETLRCIGVSLKAGNYRSAQNFQEVHLQAAVEPWLWRQARRVVKSIVRGLRALG